MALVLMQLHSGSYGTSSKCVRYRLVAMPREPTKATQGRKAYLGSETEGTAHQRRKPWRQACEAMGTLRL